MSEDAAGRTALENAWSRFATYDHGANEAQKRFIRLRLWMLAVGVAATTLAIFYTEYVEDSSVRPAFSDWRFYVWLPMMAMPILGSVLAAGASKLARGVDWLSLRGAAESIKREIFRYRCRVGPFAADGAASGSPDEKLAAAVARITGRLMDSGVLHGKLKPYAGPLPPFAPEGDDGFSALIPEQYLKWRVGDQLSYFRTKASGLERRHRIFRWSVAGLGGLGTLLAALGQEIWVPVSVGVAAAFTAYLELRNVEVNLAAYNRAALELDNVVTWWTGLAEDAKSEAANFAALVDRTETVLGSENASWVHEMQDAMAKYEERRKGDKE